VAVKIKLKRLGKIHAPQYRIVVADSRTARNGRAIEEIGIYQPMNDPSLIRVDSERVQYWLGVGAQPTEAVTAILKVTGDWQRFKGLPGAEGTLQVAAPKPSKTLAFEAAVQAAAASESKPKPKLDRAAAAVETAVEAATLADVADAVADEAVAEAIVAEVIAEEAVAEAVEGTLDVETAAAAVAEAEIAAETAEEAIEVAEIADAVADEAIVEAAVEVAEAEEQA
jgi:small subunit ribosomal protein S16